MHITKLHVDECILMPADDPHAVRRHIDPEKWKPLIMSFCRFFGVGEEVHSPRGI